MSQVKIASREEIFGRASRAAAMPSSESDKLEYVETVFEYMGFDKKFIGVLSDDLFRRWNWRFCFAEIICYRI